MGKESFSGIRTEKKSPMKSGKKQVKWNLELIIWENSTLFPEQGVDGYISTVFLHSGAKLDMIHDNCNSVNSEGRSAGHYFRDEFVKWLAEEKSDEEPTITEWRWQLFHWWIKW